jgi:aspartate/glutamate racemase
MREAPRTTKRIGLLGGVSWESTALCTNTMHKVADAITDAIGIPFVHIADTTAEAVGRGRCTEIDLLVGPEDAPVPVFDTTRLHAHRAVDLALGSEPG